MRIKEVTERANGFFGSHYIQTRPEGKSIFLHDPNGKVAKAYEELTKEVLDDGKAQRRKDRADAVR